MRSVLLLAMLAIGLAAPAALGAFPRDSVDLALTIIELEHRVSERGHAVEGEADDLEARLSLLAKAAREDRIFLEPELLAFLERGYAFLFRISTELSAEAAENELKYRKLLGGVPHDFQKRQIGGATVVIRGDATKKQVALTFDDGPSPGIGSESGTAAVLEVLREEDVLATFFLCGNPAMAYPDLVKRIAEEGHAVANHTKTHAKGKGLGVLTTEEIVEEVQVAESQILRALGTDDPLIFFRCPYGSGINSPRVNGILAENGFFNIFWTIDSHDWKSQSLTNTVRRVVESNKLSGGIVLLHDRVAGSARVTREIILTLRPRGYAFVTIPQLLGIDNEGPTRLAYREGAGLYMAGDRAAALDIFLQMARQEADSVLADDAMHYAWMIARELGDVQKAEEIQRELEEGHPASFYVRNRISLEAKADPPGLRGE